MGTILRTTKALAFAVFTVLAIAPAALAQSVSGSGYGGVAGDVQGQISGQDQLSTVGQPGVLPFTGLDLGLIVGGGLMLIAVGLLARRRARTES